MARNVKKPITDTVASKMAAARKRKRAERVEAGLAGRVTPVERLADDPTSRSKAIAAKCWDCQGGDADPCVAWRIGNCGIKACPLWGVRPHRRMEGRPVPPSLRHGGEG